MRQCICGFWGFYASGCGYNGNHPGRNRKWERRLWEADQCRKRGRGGYPVFGVWGRGGSELPCPCRIWRGKSGGDTAESVRPCGGRRHGACHGFWPCDGCYVRPADGDRWSGCIYWPDGKDCPEVKYKRPAAGHSHAGMCRNGGFHRAGPYHLKHRTWRTCG